MSHGDLPFDAFKRCGLVVQEGGLSSIPVLVCETCGALIPCTDENDLAGGPYVRKHYEWHQERGR